MDGAKHYAEAERILGGDVPPHWTRGDSVAAAQVHATLALAAATALPHVRGIPATAQAISEWAGVLK